MRKKEQNADHFTDEPFTMWRCQYNCMNLISLMDDYDGMRRPYIESGRQQWSVGV